ncbi:MAG: hypothetical protein O3B84_05260, partial [Chloroflexi bacterium]|nr:hypothetical protein [Chloroflexota bacterium]
DWPGVDRDRVAVVGYSFGAGVSVRTLMKNKGAVRCAVAVSPSLSMPPLGLEGLQGLATLRRPLLVAIGERDGLTSAVAVGEWVARLSNPNIHLHVVPDTDRSWQGKRVALATLVIDFLSETIG